MMRRPGLAAIMSGTLVQFWRDSLVEIHMALAVWR